MSSGPKGPKVRLTVTVDADVAAAAEAAVAAGSATSVSAWVNDALATKADSASKLAAMAEAIADYEAEFGAFTPEELVEQERADRQAAEAVRQAYRAQMESRTG